MKKVFSVLVFLLVTFIFLVSAAEYSGDGIYTVQEGDMITIDNGWKVEILTILMAPGGEQLLFRAYDPEDNPYPAAPYENRLTKLEGREKYGNGNVLKMELEVLEVSGERYATGSPMIAKYEKVKINIATIDEALPGGVTEDPVNSEEIEEINKDLTYKDGQAISLSAGEEVILGNGYKLKLDRFDQRWGNPYLSLYDSEDNMIDEGIEIGKGVGASLGSFVYVEDYNGESADLLITDGSKLTFGTGWNLFSIHIDDGDGYGTILESTCNKAPMWIWNNDLNDYEKAGTLEEGTKIPSGKGIWAKIQTKKDMQSDRDCEVIVSGTSGVTTKGTQLKAGWNSIGSPISAYGNREIVEGGSNFNLLSFDDILGDCRLEKGPWQFLGTEYSHFNIRNEVAGKHKFSEPFGNNLRLNRGYFIKVIDDCTLNDK